MDKKSYKFLPSEPGLLVEMYLPKKSAFQGTLFDTLEKGFVLQEVKSHFRIHEAKIKQLLEHYGEIPDYTESQIQSFPELFYGYSSYEVDGVFLNEKSTLDEERTQVIRFMFKLDWSSVIGDSQDSANIRKIKATVVRYLESGPAGGEIMTNPSLSEGEGAAIRKVEAWVGYVGLFMFGYVVCMKEIAFCGIPRVRVWLDQCLWLRDASQGGWAHTGIVPYVLWPVVSLGYKRPGAERTVLTERRMWPFVEEVAGLWSMGVLIVEEMRDMTNEGSLRRSSSFNRRIKLEPEGALGLLLLNVFHGACDALKTGWKKDVEELEEMAVWNVFANTDEIFVGSDWKHRVAAVDSKDYATAIQSIGLPVRDEYLGGVDVYIDASRKVQVDTWSGLAEFLSGHSCGRAPTPNERVLLYIVLSKYSVVADEMELQLLKVGHLAALWLIVCMDGQSSSFSRGKVRWTKVVAGKMGCALGDALEKGNWLVLSKCLEEQIGEKLRVRDVRDMDGAAIEWL